MTKYTEDKLYINLVLL